MPAQACATLRQIPLTNFVKLRKIRSVKNRLFLFLLVLCTTLPLTSCNQPKEIDLSRDFEGNAKPKAPKPRKPKPAPAKPAPSPKDKWWISRGGVSTHPYRPPSTPDLQIPAHLSSKSKHQLEKIKALGILTPPIKGSRVSVQDSHMPGSVRSYRKGYHEGLDFYPGTSGKEIAFDYPVVAVGRGRIVRIWSEESGAYKEPTTATRERLLAKANWKISGGLDPADLDTLRGRQVWIDLGNGVIARYCHLNRINPSLKLGQTVNPGEYLAHIGNSGTSNGARGTREDAHLHFELRIGDSFLGEGLDQDEARRAFQVVFPPTQDLSKTPPPQAKKPPAIRPPDPPPEEDLEPASVPPQETEPQRELPPEPPIRDEEFQPEISNSAPSEERL